ncbi:MAG TPA: TonB family protein [Caulobacteraceae bacterium]|jgi:protein TonB|nr:TonB family protein [Caulobacteraceae bacterium]
MQRNPRPYAVIASLAGHLAGVALLLTQSQAGTSGPTGVAPEALDLRMAVQVSLVRTPLSSAAPITQSQFAPPAAPHHPAPPPVLTSKLASAASGGSALEQASEGDAVPHSIEARASPVLANATIATIGVGSDYERRLFDHIERFLVYPAGAPDSRPHGVAQILFRMDRSGKVLGVWLRQSSGFPAFDAAAIAAVWRAQPLPAIPADFPDFLNVTAPVEFTPPLKQAAG